MGVVAQAWTAAVERLGGDTAMARAAADLLEARYAEPHRAYHVAAHIEAVLCDAARLVGETGLDDASAAVVTLAACAHDVVYEARPGADERASAAWARDRLAAAGVPGEYVDRVEQLVLATADHDAGTGELATRILLDADLAILAAPAESYAAYVAAVRREYAGLDDEQWRAGRARVLSSLLGRPRLFGTEPASAAWEDDARRNMRAELAGLRT